jgi:hypothetical protein
LLVHFSQKASFALKQKRAKKDQNQGQLSSAGQGVIIQNDYVLIRESATGIERDDVFVFRSSSNVCIAVAANMRTIVLHQDAEWLQNLDRDSLRTLFDEQADHFPERSEMGRAEPPLRLVPKRFLFISIPNCTFAMAKPVTIVENGVLLIRLALSKENFSFYAD